MIFASLLGEYMLRAAVILSGCGHSDGSEIREAVLALLELDRCKVRVQCFAPNISQLEVIDHLNGEISQESRNVLIESARIARGNVLNLSNLLVEDYDMLIIPGGFGVVKNLAGGISFSEVLPAMRSAVIGFFKSQKPIGAICIAPALIVSILSELASPKVTIGDDETGLIRGLGGVHEVSATDNFSFDENNLIFSTAAYMKNDNLYKIYRGIGAMIDAMILLLSEEISRR